MLFQKSFRLSLRTWLRTLGLRLQALRSKNMTRSKIVKSMRTTKTDPMFVKIFESLVIFSFSSIGSVRNSKGMNSPRAIVLKAWRTMVTFAGCYAFYHSVKNTTNWNVLIMPQSSLSEEPRMMFRAMLPVANVLAVLVAVDIEDAICSASASSICLGSLITN